MKRKLILGFLAFFLIAGTAYAAGKSVSVYVNDKQVQSGQIIDGQTMLPLRAIGEALGAHVEWDNVRKQANITMPQQASQEATEGLTLAELNKIGESVAMVYALNSEGQPIAGGSAFVTEQTLVTNSHVLDGATSIRVEFVNEQHTYNVSDAIFNDAEKDLAGFKYTGSKKSLPINNDELNRGDKVYSLGFPLGRFTISEGEITAFTTWGDDISHSAATTSGSSGGVLADSQGRVIGVNVGAYEHFSRAVHRDKLLDLLNK